MVGPADPPVKPKPMKSLAGKWTEKAIFGKKGIDIRCRVVLDMTLNEQMANNREIAPAARDAVRISFILGTFPKNYGEFFLRFPAWLALVLGALFIALVPPPIEKAVLVIHPSLGSPLAYVVLALQWIAFYVVMSALAAAVVSLVAFIAYSKRLAKPRPSGLEIPPFIAAQSEELLTEDEVAFEIMRQTAMQGAAIAGNIGCEVKGLKPQNVREQWATEFAIAKFAVLSVRAEELPDEDLKYAILGQIDSFLRGRTADDSGAPIAFQKYAGMAREEDAAADKLGYSMSCLFKQRLDRALAALPKDGRPPLSDVELRASQSVMASYCWLLKNETEESVFGD